MSSENSMLFSCRSSAISRAHLLSSPQFGRNTRLLMPCWACFHRGFHKRSAVLQLIKHSTSTDSPFPHKWVSRYIHSPTQIFNALKLRKALTCGPLKHLQVAQLSGNIAKSDKKEPNKVPSKALLEVQRVLVDYLHYTRNLHFTDAEHISMNAPCFIQKMLSTVGAEKHISKAVDRFLQYNPINEFEPFFESIGIQPPEIVALLPPGQIYLNENEAMMVNVSILWNYGIPRNKLGQLYKEEKEIFNYPNGVLQGKLRSYEDLGISKASLAKIFICCPCLLKGNFREEFVTLVNDLSGFGVEKNMIVSLFENSKYGWNGIFEKLRLLYDLGCPGEKVSTLIKTRFRIFVRSSEKDLSAKVEFLIQLGLKREHVGNMILGYPGILIWNLKNCMAKNLELLRSIGLEQGELRNIVQCHPYVLGTGSLKKLIQVMDEFGLDKKEIARLVRENPRIASSWTQWSKIDPDQMNIMASERADRVQRMELVIARGRKHKHSTGEQGMPFKEQNMKHKIGLLSKLGFQENSDKMTEVAKQIFGRYDEVQERINYLVNLGLSFNVVCQMISSSPRILNQSKDLIEKKVDFLLNNFRRPLWALTSFPSYLCYHLEDRIKPRCRMYEWLKEKNLIRREHSISTIVAPSDEKFVKHFGSLDPEAPKVFQTLKTPRRKRKLKAD